MTPNFPFPAMVHVDQATIRTEFERVAERLSTIPLPLQATRPATPRTRLNRKERRREAALARRCGR